MDQERFAQLYSELYARVSAYALHRAPPDLAAEAVDETFLIAWRKRDRLPAGRELPWLLVTTAKVLANHRRRRAHQDALGAELARLSAGEVAGGAAPEKLAAPVNVAPEKLVLGCRRRLLRSRLMRVASMRSISMSVAGLSLPQ